ncbi:MAG: hypothetical protein WD875_12665 [Pirellulales bacterium]
MLADATGVARSRRTHRWTVAIAIVAAIVGGRRLAADNGTADAGRILLQDAPAPTNEAPSPKSASEALRDESIAKAPGAGAGLAFKPLADIDLDISPSGRLLPGDEAAKFFDRAGHHVDLDSRGWAIREFTWTAAGFCYRPLYFEEVNLERYGYSFGVAQPAVSSAQFFGRSLALPGLMAVRRPWECVYPLGYDRPGDCAPYRLYGPAAR